MEEKKSNKHGKEEKEEKKRVGCTSKGGKTGKIGVNKLVYIERRKSREKKGKKIKIERT